MTTLIKKDSLSLAILIIACVLLLFLGGGLGLAYMGGVFTGKADVIANDRRIADLADKERASEAKSKNVETKTTETSDSPGTQIHPVVQDNGVGNGEKSVNKGLDDPQQGDYHQQQN